MPPASDSPGQQDHISNSAAGNSPVPERFRSTSAPSYPFAGQPFDQQPRTAGTGQTTTTVMRSRTWPIVECDQNTSPNLYDVVTQEVADAMPPGTEVIIAFTDRLNRPRVALAWGYAALGVVTEHKPTSDGEDVVVCVRAI